ncbi:MAG: hypothetical protein QM796_05610 [Chthoniobacteraceae bacterium]
MPDAPAVFRRALTRHNQHVLLVAGWSLGLVVMLWMLVYWGLYAVLLLALTVTNPFGATAPVTFPVHFILFTALFFAMVFLERKLSPQRRLRDKSTKLEIAMDLLLALPRATLTSLENLRALLFLSRHERQTAWALLERLHERHQIPLTEIPQEVPNDRLASRVIHTLQMLDVAELRERNSEWLLALRGTDTARLMTRRFSLKKTNS